MEKQGSKGIFTFLKEVEIFLVNEKSKNKQSGTGQKVNKSPSVEIYLHIRRTIFNYYHNSFTLSILNR